MPEFQGSTDKEETFQIKSMLLDACWLDAEAHVNGTATLEVRTLYVAHGSAIKITLKDREGKTLESASGFVYAGLYRKKVALTPAHAPGIFFEVDLADHGLKATGQRLLVKPAIRLYDAVWKDKKTGAAVAKVKRGMDLLVEVKTEGLLDGADGRIVFRETHGQGGEHGASKDIIAIPVPVKDKKLALAWRFEYPRDTHELSSAPEKKRTEEDYAPPRIYFEAQSGGAIARGPEAEFIDFVIVEVSDSAGNPLPDQQVKVTLPDGTVQDASSDADGLVTIPETKPGQVKVELAQKPAAPPPPPAPKPAAPKAPPLFILKASPWPDHAVNVPLAPGGDLQRRLQPLLDQDPILKKALAAKNLKFAVANVRNTGSLDYFGVNDESQWDAASTAKLTVLAAAYYLKFALKKAVAEIHAAAGTVDPADEKELFAIVNKSWATLIKARFPRRPPATAPKWGEIFTAEKSASGWAVEFKSKGGDDIYAVNAAHDHQAKINALGFKEWLYLMAAYSDNHAASKCINDLGFQYVNGAMQDAGFYDGDKGGLWLHTNFAGAAWWSRTGTGQSKQVCRYFCALALNGLVAPASSGYIADTLEKLPNPSGTGSWIRNSLPYWPRSMNAKVGLTPPHYSEGALLEGVSPGGTPYRYVLVIFENRITKDHLLERLAPLVHSTLVPE